jgi:hypothetical protein
MGNNELFYRGNGEQRNSGSSSFYTANSSMSVLVHKGLKMAESKALMLILSILWPPIYIFAWLSNLDNIKSTILFIVALIMGMIRFYFWIIRTRQNNRLKELDILEREKMLLKK